MSNSPSYPTSPFMGMVEGELIKSETIETIFADSQLEDTIVEGLEEKFD